MLGGLLRAVLAAEKVPAEYGARVLAQQPRVQLVQLGLAVALVRPVHLLQQRKSGLVHCEDFQITLNILLLG